jgi:hypothetical protein
MLISSTNASTTSYNNPRQIAAQSQTSSQVMYTVPAGKKFVGTLWSNQAGNNVYITPSGGAAVNINLPGVSTQYAASSPMPVTLVAGTIVTNLATNSPQYLLGVETDA